MARPSRAPDLKALVDDKENLSKFLERLRFDPSIKDKSPGPQSDDGISWHQVSRDCVPTYGRLAPADSDDEAERIDDRRTSFKEAVHAAARGAEGSDPATGSTEELPHEALPYTLRGSSRGKTGAQAGDIGDEQEGLGLSKFAPSTISRRAGFEARAAEAAARQQAIRDRIAAMSKARSMSPATSTATLDGKEQMNREEAEPLRAKECVESEKERVKQELYDAQVKEKERFEAELKTMTELQEKTLRAAEAREKTRLEEEAKEKARRDAEAHEKARLEAEAQEKARRDAEAQEKARREAEAQEKACLEAETQEKARREAEAKEKVRLERGAELKPRAEAEREEAERQEMIRLEAERHEAARLEQERLDLEAELEAERQEAALREAELEVERLEAEFKQAERLDEVDRIKNEKAGLEEARDKLDQSQRQLAERFKTERAELVEIIRRLEGDLEQLETQLTKVRSRLEEANGRKEALEKDASMAQKHADEHRIKLSAKLQEQDSRLFAIQTEKLPTATANVSPVTPMTNKSSKPAPPITPKTNMSSKPAASDTNGERTLKEWMEEGARVSVETENKLRFTAWPKRDERPQGPSQVRRVKLTDLPSDSTINSIQGLVWGGAVESIEYKTGQTVAQVLFLQAESCKKYFEATANGIQVPDKAAFVTVELAPEAEPVHEFLTNCIEQGVTRNVRAIDVDAEWGKIGLERLASSKGRKVDDIVVGFNGRGLRLVEFRFASIYDAFKFKSALARDSDWDHCNIVFAMDPCAKYEGVHTSKH